MNAYEEHLKCPKCGADIPASTQLERDRVFYLKALTAIMGAAILGLTIQDWKAGAISIVAMVVLYVAVEIITRARA